MVMLGEAWGWVEQAVGDVEEGGEFELGGQFIGGGHAAFPYGGALAVGRDFFHADDDGDEGFHLIHRRERRELKIIFVSGLSRRI